MLCAGNFALPVFLYLCPSLSHACSFSLSQSWGSIWCSINNIMGDQGPGTCLVINPTLKSVLFPGLYYLPGRRVLCLGNWYPHSASSLFSRLTAGLKHWGLIPASKRCLSKYLEVWEWPMQCHQAGNCLTTRRVQRLCWEWIIRKWMESFIETPCKMSLKEEL